MGTYQPAGSDVGLRQPKCAPLDDAARCDDQAQLYGVLFLD